MPFPTFKTQDEIPEAFRDEYEEKDGAWVAKVEDVTTLKDTLKSEREKREAAEKLSKKVGDEMKRLEMEREANKQGVKPEELQKIRAAIEAEYQGKLDEAGKQIHELTFGAQLDAAMVEANVIDLADGRAVFGSRFEMVDGKLVPKDDKSVTPKAFIESKLRTEKPHLFKGTQADGGGAGGTKGGMPKQEIKGTPEQRMAAAFAAGATE